VREALRQGTGGAGWDNVSWIGEWDFDLSTVTSPVLLWYGGDDRIVPPARGLWLSQNLPRARLVVRDGDGYLGTYDHLGEMLDALTEPGRPIAVMQASGDGHEPSHYGPVSPSCHQ
jgi:pimeloyl-ACP methyl ester carboxylesterase